MRKQNNKEINELKKKQTAQIKSNQLDINNTWIQIQESDKKYERERELAQTPLKNNVCKIKVPKPSKFKLKIRRP